MLQTLLIGAPGGDRNGRVAQFIRYVLHYDSLLIRFAISGAVWLVFGRLLEWSIPAKLGFLAFEIYASLLLIRAVAGLSQRGQLGRILIAMWLPIAVVLAAFWLFFINDQGRELGIGLMNANGKGFFLGVVLVYWALNNWLSARVGLVRAFPKPKKEQMLLFWGPRLVGVMAHLLAALSLSFAALSQHDVQGRVEPYLVFAGPLAILLATGYVWLLDYGYFSERSDAEKQPAARKLMHVSGALELVLLAGLIYAWWLGKVPTGFLLGTLFIAASAGAFLAWISFLRSKEPLAAKTPDAERDRDRQAEQAGIARWTFTLAAIMVIGTAAIWTWPMIVGQYFGSLIIACFSFGSFLALANLFDLLAGKLTHYARTSHFAIRPRAIGAVFVCFLILPAILTSLTQSFHRVRLCADPANECKPATAPKAVGWAVAETPAQRPTVSEAARAWYGQAEPVYHAVHPDQPVPMFIVATAGGGIRAAYWTATVLEKLESDLGGKGAIRSSDDKLLSENLLHNLLFAISGVSGGSVGAAAYAAAVHAHESSGDAIAPTNYLKEDFLAPGLASMIFIDGPANVLPDLGQIDRGQALELGFEQASRTKSDKDGWVSHNFLSFFPTAAAVEKTKSWRPALLFNATHQETGRRMIASHIKIERNIFLDSYDALQVMGSDVRMSTAAHNSARFTYISPAGDLLSATKPAHNRGYVIDGGYFENYGAETALELARKAIEAIDPAHGTPGHNDKVKLVVLQISSDPTLQGDRTLVRVHATDDGACVVSSFKPGPKSDPNDPANYLEVIDATLGHPNEGEDYVLSSANELSAPLLGIMSVRQAHGTIAAAELAASICQGKGKVEAAMKDQMTQKTADSSGAIRTAASVKSDDAPHFSHMAMCEKSSNGGVGISPPLGWVLSDTTRGKFKDILGDCGNPDELSGLETALGLPFPTSTTTATNLVNPGH
jgi:hypothetical protein